MQLQEAISSMWTTTGRVVEGILNQEIYAVLKDTARRKGVITYSEIAPLANLDMSNVDHREEMGKILGIISTYEHQQGRPMLSAIVVHREDNMPGKGFFQLAETLGLLKARQDKIGFWCKEVARVHNSWGSEASNA